MRDEVVREQRAARGASSSSISFMMPLNSATSPLTRTGRNRHAICVPWPSSDSGFCGFLNRIIPVSGSGLTLTILQPLRRRLLQLGQHARVAGAGVLADDEDAVGVREVLDLHGRLADADRLGQPEAARLVAHVRAVGQVVGAELAREQAVQERRLVAGAARRVERRLVRRRRARSARARSARTRRPTRSARSGRRRAAAPSDA